jgi:hypothetical protein
VEDQSKVRKVQPVSRSVGQSIQVPWLYRGCCRSLCRVTVARSYPSSGYRPGVLPWRCRGLLAVGVAVANRGCCRLAVAGSENFVAGSNWPAVAVGGSIGVSVDALPPLSFFFCLVVEPTNVVGLQPFLLLCSR